MSLVQCGSSSLSNCQPACDQCVLCGNTFHSLHERPCLWNEMKGLYLSELLFIMVQMYHYQWAWRNVLHTWRVPFRNLFLHRLKPDWLNRTAAYHVVSSAVIGLLWLLAMHAVNSCFSGLRMVYNFHLLLPSGMFSPISDQRKTTGTIVKKEKKNTCSGLKVHPCLKQHCGDCQISWIGDFFNRQAMCASCVQQCFPSKHVECTESNLFRW